MEQILIQTGAVIAGFVMLIIGADKFVLGASTLARHFGVSPLIIGLTIVSLGTSAPEIFTSAAAALSNSAELAIGNVIGSNIANIGLILGCTALVAPLIIPDSLMRQEVPALLLVSFISFALFLDGDLDALDGWILLAMMAIFLWRMYVSSELKKGSKVDEDSDIAEYLAPISSLAATGYLLGGLLLMVLGSNTLVWGARHLALTLGISELVVGLTVVAIGTSLPELATSVTSALKGHHELAIGNVVGSNIFNLLLVLPVPAFVGNVNLSNHALTRDFPVMLLITLLLCTLIFFLLRKNRRLGRGAGLVFLTLYFAYTALLILQKA